MYVSDDLRSEALQIVSIKVWTWEREHGQMPAPLRTTIRKRTLIDLIRSDRCHGDVTTMEIGSEPLLTSYADLIASLMGIMGQHDLRPLTDADTRLMDLLAEYPEA